MKRLYFIGGAVTALAALAACSGGKADNIIDAEPIAGVADCRALTDTLQSIAAACPGEIGVALIAGDDTIVVNNEDKYPLMSVFKLHQSISLCRTFGESDIPLDRKTEVERRSLNPDTWSPMLKDYPDSVIVISAADLLRYTLTQSDNNASNYMFDQWESVARVDSFISTLIPRDAFRLSYTEEEMWHDHDKSYANHTSPLGAALLMERLFTDSIMPAPYADFLRTTLGECATGIDRIAAPLADIEGVTVAHKTGSGYRNADGLLVAHNDVAFITLPDGTHYTLAVFVKDFAGTEAEASAAISRISQAAYSAITKQ